MTPELTPAAARALVSARRWAEAAGDAQVEPRHLLLALLEEEEGRVAGLLQGHGLPLAGLRHAVAPGLPLLAPLADGETGPHDPALHPLIYAARHWALELTGETTVSSEHLLVALLKQDSALVGRLHPLGLDVDRLVAGLQGEHGTPLPLDEPLDLATPTEVIDTARILDANANRAREGLRVIEEYVRFALDDAFLSRELKSLRHELGETLGEVLAELSPALLLEARETQHDVGTRLATPAEAIRHSLRDVAQVNLKRLEESLRALEEYGKLHGPQLGRAFESLRYRVYTLERVIVLGATARERLADARLYVLLTGAKCSATLDWVIQEAAAGGAEVFQLREKDLGDRELLARARDVRRWTRAAKALFIMNDRPDIARLAEADGVHVGQEELSVKDVRRIVGPDMLIGVSTHDLDQLRQAILDGASYVGVGPTFPSATKEFAGFAGLEFVRQAAVETSLPAFAIGGIGPENIDQVLATGIRRVAVSQAICAAEEPRLVAAALRQALDDFRESR